MYQCSCCCCCLLNIIHIITTFASPSQTINPRCQHNDTLMTSQVSLLQPLYTLQLRDLPAVAKSAIANNKYSMHSRQYGTDRLRLGSDLFMLRYRASVTVDPTLNPPTRLEHLESTLRGSYTDSDPEGQGAGQGAVSCRDRLQCQIIQGISCG